MHHVRHPEDSSWPPPVSRRCALKAPKRFRPHLEALEDRFAPAIDIWNNGTGDGSFETANNWSLFRVPTYVVGGNQDVAQFQAMPAGVAANCTASANHTILGLNLTSAYTGLLTLSGSTLQMVGTASGQNGIFNGSGVKFSLTTDRLDFQNGGVQMASNGGFSGARGSVLIEKGSQFTIQNAQLVNSSTADFLVGTALATSGSLVMNNTKLFSFKGGAGIYVDVGGTLSIPVNTTGIGGLIGLDGGANGSIIDNFGQVIRQNAGGGQYTVVIPLINETGSTLLVDTSLLEFSGVNANSNNVSIWQKGGTTSLKGGASLTADAGYQQDAGTLQTVDAALATLQTMNAGAIVTINGGNVKLSANFSTQYGSLKVNSTLTFNGGEYDPKINGAATGQRDWIEATSINIVATTSKLVVTVNGMLGAGTWDILVSDAGQIYNKFSSETLNGTTSSLPNTKPGPYRLTAGGGSPVRRAPEQFLHASDLETNLAANSLPASVIEAWAIVEAENRHPGSTAPSAHSDRRDGFATDTEEIWG